MPVGNLAIVVIVCLFGFIDLYYTELLKLKTKIAK